MLDLKYGKAVKDFLKGGFDEREGHWPLWVVVFYGDAHSQLELRSLVFKEG